MAAGERLYPVEAALLAALGRSTIGLNDASDVVLVHLLGERTVQGFADRRWRDCRQPVRRVRLAAAAKVRDLAHQRGAVLVYAVGELLQPGNDIVDADVQLPEDIGAVGGDIGRAADHG